MTCKQLGGACDKEFRGASFESIAEQSKQHGIEMSEKGDKDHKRAMEEIRGKMNNPKEMMEWIGKKRDEFNALPER